MLKNVLRCAHFPPGSPSLSKRTDYGASCVAKIRPFANRPGWIGFKQTFCIHIILQQCFGNKMMKYLYGYGPCAALESAFVPARFSSVFSLRGFRHEPVIWFKVYLSEFFYESMTSLRKRVSIKSHITARSAGFPIALKHIICFKGLFVNTSHSVKPHFSLKFTNVRVTYNQEKKIQCIYGSCKGKQTANQ